MSSPDAHDNVAGTAALVLGIAGLLPVLPFVGSVAAVVCGAVACHEHPRDARARLGIALGIVGVVAPLVALIVYCVVLGYPFPLHRYRPD